MSKKTKLLKATATLWVIFLILKNIHNIYHAYLGDNFYEGWTGYVAILIVAIIWLFFYCITVRAIWIKDKKRGAENEKI